MNIINNIKINPKLLKIIKKYNFYQYKNNPKCLN